MTLRFYLILMSLGALLCWIAWLFVVGSIDPKEADAVGFMFFYVSLFLALTGTAAVIGFIIRKNIVKSDGVVFHHVKRTFRHGLLIAAVAVGLLALQQAQMLRWWNALLLLLLFAGLEGLLFTNRKFQNRDFVR